MHPIHPATAAVFVRQHRDACEAHAATARLVRDGRSPRRDRSGIGFGALLPARRRRPAVGMS
jgi:hypothetical protein